MILLFRNTQVNIQCCMLETLKDLIAPQYYNYCYEICRHHHERFDGQGYPYAIAGDNIPLISQIVAVADVYEALTSERVYKKAYSFEQASAIIHDGCGTSFSPDIVMCFENTESRLRKIIEDGRVRAAEMEHSKAADAKFSIALCMPDALTAFELEKKIRQSLKFYEKEAGIDVFKSSDDMMETFKTRGFDCIFFDTVLPDITPLAEELLAADSELKLVYVTSDYEIPVMSDCSDFAYVLHKPFNRRAVDDVVCKIYR